MPQISVACPNLSKLNQPFQEETEESSLAEVSNHIKRSFILMIPRSQNLITIQKRRYFLRNHGFMNTHSLSLDVAEQAMTE